MNPLHLFYITNIRIMQDITNGRCGWCGTDELYVKYHDQEWGKLVTDDKTLFEFLVLESAQAGLSWITILRKREGYRKAFYNFDAELVAQMTDEDIERLMQFEGIVKNRLKNQIDNHECKTIPCRTKGIRQFFIIIPCHSFPTKSRLSTHSGH